MMPTESFLSKAATNELPVSLIAFICRGAINPPAPINAKFKATPIKLNYKKLDENTGYAPYFREVLKSELREALKGLKNPNGDDYSIYNDGLKVYTTINIQMQEIAEEGMAQHMLLLQKDPEFREMTKGEK